MVLGGLFLTSISSELSPTIPLQPSSFPKELQYAQHPYFLPLCSNFYFLLKPCGQKLLSSRRQGSRSSHTLLHLGKSSIPMADVHHNSNRAGHKILTSTTKIECSPSQPFKKKKSLIWSFPLESGRIPPCLLYPPCLCQVPKSITLTTQCITVIAWVSLAVFETITKADSIDWRGAPCSKL